MVAGGGAKRTLDPSLLVGGGLVKRRAFDLKPAAIKLLLPSAEVACIYGERGEGLSEIQQACGVTLRFSAETNLYPGTALRELAIQGESCEAVLEGATHGLQKVLQGLGAVGTDAPLEVGECRVRVVVPAKCAKMVIGIKGAAIEQLRQETGMRVKVDPNFIPAGPPTDLSEQALCFDGPLMGLHLALMTVLAHMVSVASEQWFPAWAALSNAGSPLPGITLFEPGSAKGKGKSKGREERQAAVMGGDQQAPVVQAQQRLCMKILVAQKEAGAVLGKNGEKIRAIEQITNAAMQMSARESLYPGTPLQELRIWGATEEIILSGAQYAFGQITDQVGVLGCGEEVAGPEDARVRILLPSVAARALLSGDGETLRQLRAQTGMNVHVEPQPVPPGTPAEFSEQVICFSGPLDGAVVALQACGGFLSQVWSEPWFETWASTSNCGLELPGLVLSLDRELALAAKAMAKAAKARPEDGVLALPGIETFGGIDETSAAFVEATAALAQQQEMNVAQMAAAIQAAAQQALVVSMAQGAASSGQNVLVAVKLLVSDAEAYCVLGQDGSTLSEIQAATSTSMRVAEGGHYPGTSLHELTIQGMSKESVLMALIHAVTIIMEVLGSMASGDENVDKGQVRMKLVVPAKAAASIIGVGGNSVKQICQQCSVRIQVDQSPVPAGSGASEQAVLLCGSSKNTQSALPMILEHVGMIATEKDLLSWAAHSNAGTKIPGLTLFSGNKGGPFLHKGKGKGRWSFRD